MAEKKVEMVPYEVRYLCDNCGTEMRYTGKALLSDPPRFTHECPKCPHLKDLVEVYPVIRWEEAEHAKDS